MGFECIIYLTSTIKSTEVSGLLRDPGRVEGRRRDGAQEVVQEDGATVPPGQEQGSGRGRGLQGDWQRICGM